MQVNGGHHLLMTSPNSDLRLHYHPTNVFACVQKDIGASYSDIICFQSWGITRVSPYVSVQIRHATIMKHNSVRMLSMKGFLED